MRKRTLLLLMIGTLVAALVGGVLGVVVIAMLNPGNKGPHVSSDGIMGAFLVGAVVGGGVVVVAYRAVAARRKPSWLDDER